jgi:patatin-like phospholipase/acyl hydrolase
MTDSQNTPRALCRVLSLDGGGAKGFYTLGVLHELEALLGPPLWQHFDLMFGTSTGSIIAALLALGDHPVAEIHRLYKDHVPAVMRPWTAHGRTAALKELAKEIFQKASFTDVKTGIGIVATRWDLEKPMIFKHSVRQAHGSKSSFVAGFGVSIGDAVRASCSAYPLFERCIIKTGNNERVELIDGGYCANNPTLYAIADAVRAFGTPREAVQVVSLGVGVYPPKPKRLWHPRESVETAKTLAAKVFLDVDLLQKTLDVNTTSMEQLRSILFPDVPAVRINEAFSQPEMATDFMESDLEKLDLLYQRGRASFGKQEKELRTLLNISDAAKA